MGVPSHQRFSGPSLNTVKWRCGVSGGALPVVPTKPTSAPRPSEAPSARARGVPVEVRVVVAEGLGGIELVHRQAASRAVEELDHSAVVHGEHTSPARRQDVERLVRVGAAAIGEVVSQVGGLHARDGQSQVPGPQSLEIGAVGSGDTAHPKGPGVRGAGRLRRTRCNGGADSRIAKTIIRTEATKPIATNCRTCLTGLRGRARPSSPRSRDRRAPRRRRAARQDLQAQDLAQRRCRGRDQEGERKHDRRPAHAMRQCKRGATGRRVYLRLNGAKVPSVYGPSADDNRF